MKYVKVVFIGQEDSYSPTLYSYMSQIDVKKDELVVVQARGTHALAVVKSVSSSKDAKATRWIVQKVDLEYSRLLDENGKKIVEKEKELLERIAERERIKAMEALVASDPVAKKLYEELKELKGE